MKLIFPLLLACCSTAYGKENVTIHGKVTHRISDSILVSPSITQIAYQPINYYARLDKEGNFSVTLTVPEGFTHVQITHGNQETEVYVQPGADLTLTIDASNFDSSLHYEGNGKELANFMAKHMLATPTMKKISIQGQMFFGKEQPAFKEELKKLEDKELDFLRANSAGLPTGFSDYFKASQRYEVYSVMAKYPSFHEMAKQKTMGVKNIPKENYAIIGDIPEAFNDDYINMPAYYAYVTNVFYLQIFKDRAELNVPDSVAWPGDTTLTMAYERMPPKTAEFYAGSRIYSDTKKKPMELIDREFATFKKHFPDRKGDMEIIEHAIAFKKTIANGKPEVDFDITTPEGKTMKLSELKGNVVYIDFWSRGCVGCIAEMGASKKVREHFKDKPVRFVYVSLDPEETIWKEAIKDFDIDGINTHVDQRFESDIVKKYGFYGIPAYFMVDKNGNFAHADDIARPGSTEKLIGQIEKLLE